MIGRKFIGGREVVMFDLNNIQEPETFMESEEIYVWTII